MKTKIFAIVFVAMLLLSALGAIYVPTANSSVPSQPVGDNEPYPIDGTPELEGMTVSWAQPDTGNTWTVIVYNYYLGGFYYLNFDCIVQGATCNVWVGLSPKKWYDPTNTIEYHDERVLNGEGVDDDVFYFAYPWSWNAHIVSYRYLDGYRDYVTVPQLKAVANEYDSKIGQKCVNFFGDYDHSRTGPLGDGKIQILVFNIRDEFFYGDFSLGFIMGYFWSYVSDLNNANIIHIDTWQWYRRQGPTPDGGVGCPYIAVPYTGSTLLPYQYEGTIAHEFQHLIHNDNDADEYSWVNEGCSTLAEFICGYGHTTNLFYYIAYYWDTSLVIWEGNLQNYGVVYLWTLYMYEHYGGQPLVWDVVHEQANGIQGWNNVLKKHHICKNFDQIFQDWAMANYLDDTSFAHGIYGYYNLDLPCAASGGWDIPYSIAFWGAYDEVYPTGSRWSARLPYIADYWELYNGAPALKVKFNGDDYAGIFPHSPTNEWYSDGTAWSWFRVGKTFTIPSTGATLKFWSNYDIEEDWDYGYVEVHDLYTGEWYTLPGINTVSTIKNPEDNPNTPSPFEPTDYLAAGRWKGFTGNSGGWYQELMDLTPFAGHNIEVYFTYWTDPYTLGLGWYIDDVEIPELGFFDNVESGANGWAVNAGWYITTGVIPNKFQVNFITTVNLTINKKTTTLYYTSHMCLNKAQDGCMILAAINTKFATFGPSVMIVSSQPGYEHTWATYWQFTAEILTFHH